MTLPQDPTLFWILAAALAALGLAFVLLPLLRRGEGGRGRRTQAVLLAVALPALAIGLYLALGQPETLQPGADAAAAPPAAEEAAVAAPAGPEVPELEARVRERPEDGDAWLLLGQRYVEAGRYPDAESAFKRATELLPETARAWSGYAEALALVRDNNLAGEPMDAIYRALELDGKDPKGLELAGLYHLTRGAYSQAAYYWNRLARSLPEDSPFGQEIAAAAREARRRGMMGMGVTIGETLPREGSPAEGDVAAEGAAPAGGDAAATAPAPAPSPGGEAAPSEGAPEGVVSAGAPAAPEPPRPAP